VDADSFLWSMIFGAVGAGYFLYGKTMGRPMLLILGALLYIFPYVISDLTSMLLIGGALTLAPFFLK